MLKYVISLFAIFSSYSSFADKFKGFKIETQFDYSNSDKKIVSKNAFILAEDNKGWTTLTEPKNGVALLGRVVKSDKAALQFEYIVVDTTKNNAVISTPAIIAKLGEKAEITLGTETEKVAISLLATPTDYSTKK